MPAPMCWLAPLAGFGPSSRDPVPGDSRANLDDEGRRILLISLANLLQR
jgi:hypothetical protein